MNRAKVTTPLFKRVVTFLGIFIIISGLIGPPIIAGGILYRDGFSVYAHLGKAIIFGIIAFWLLTRQNTRQIELKPWQPILLLWFIGVIVFFTAGWFAVTNLINGERTVSNMLVAHGGLLLAVATAMLGSIGPTNSKRIAHFYWRQLVQSIVIAGLFYVFLQLVYMTWQPLAAMVLASVTALLALTAIPTIIVPPNIIMTDTFSVTIAQYCSGVESIALFSGLYIIVGLLERHRLRIRVYLGLFLPALLILFVFNIFRIFLLIVIAYYINAEFAFTIFHTYAGLVFFILYSAVFWAVAYTHIITPPREPHAHSAGH